jgi:NAD(P)-dependent dehydrogenase (short-subunit alcohol dehydrogenase family)
MQPKSVVITGASTGIGEACALRLDHCGFRVFAGVRTESDGDLLRGKSSDRLTPVLIDVSDEKTLDRAVTRVADEVGGHGLTGLLNNAGVTGAGPLEYLPSDVLRQVLNVNVIGLLATTRAFLPLLRASGAGRIVMMGSIMGVVGLPANGAYCASKAAVAAIADVLRLELRSAGITVSLVAPGGVRTPIWNKGIGNVNDMLDLFPEDTRGELTARYGSMLDAARNMATRQAEYGSSADNVAKAVEHALTAPRPAARYIVGRDARLLLTLNRLPLRLFDRIRLRMFGQQI